jgi:hypothetical protein
MSKDTGMAVVVGGGGRGGGASVGVGSATSLCCNTITRGHKRASPPPTLNPHAIPA